MINIITTIIAELIRIRWCLQYVGNALSHSLAEAKTPVAAATSAWILPDNVNPLNCIKAPDSVRLEIAFAIATTTVIVLLGLEEQWKQPRSVLATILFILMCTFTQQGRILAILTAPQLTAALLHGTQFWVSLRQPFKKLVRTTAGEIEKAMHSSKKKSSYLDKEVLSVDDDIDQKSMINPKRDTSHRRSSINSNLNPNVLPRVATLTHISDVTGHQRVVHSGAKPQKPITAPNNTGVTKRTQGSFGQ